MFGRMAYVLNTMGALWAYPFHSMNVVVDGVAHPAVSVIISKGQLYGGRYVLVPHAMHERAGFAVVLFGTAGCGPACATAWPCCAARWPGSAMSWCWTRAWSRSSPPPACPCRPTGMRVVTPRCVSTSRITRCAWPARHAMWRESPPRHSVCVIHPWPP
ncbi:hypothetical protein RAA17_11335 [Komagataeibacter rhaeticus]|nr:hypothetical protein [Komagataeibacter rhaeticus]